jgi:hypothetical protein
MYSGRALKHSQIAGVPGKSRHVAKFIFRNVRVHLGQSSIEFTGGQIALHFLIPRVVAPLMETGGNFRPFLQAQLLHCFFDFLNAHGLIILGLHLISSRIMLDCVVAGGSGGRGGEMADAQDSKNPLLAISGRHALSLVTRIKPLILFGF